MQAQHDEFVKALHDHDVETIPGVPQICSFLEPGKLMIPAGNPTVTRELRKRGLDVTEIDLSEFTKGGGGPTCMTIPLIRDDED